MGESSRSDLKDFVEELFKEFNEILLPKLRGITDETKRYLYFVAWLNTKLVKKGIGRLIITGGFAVELYTGRVYRTMDVDIVVEGTHTVDIVTSFLSKFSERIGRGYLAYHDLLVVKSIDIVSSTYNKVGRPVKIYVEEMYVEVEPPEELIVTYLGGWKFWGSTEDRDKALWLYLSLGEKIDEEFLASRVMQANVEDKLNELKETLKELQTKEH